MSSFGVTKARTLLGHRSYYKAPIMMFRRVALPTDPVILSRAMASSTSAERKLRKTVVALDWTPNTNHLGFFVAKARGLYEAKGLDVKLLSPSDPEFSASYVDGAGGQAPFVTPCSKLADRTADFAMNSPEGPISQTRNLAYQYGQLTPLKLLLRTGVVNWNTAKGRPQLKAVAAILQGRTSAIVTMKDSGLDRPAKLDGKVRSKRA